MAERSSQDHLWPWRGCRLRSSGPHSRSIPSLLTLPVSEVHHASPTDSLKCIAWKGRAVVVGFAGGKIEQVLAPPYQLNFMLSLLQLPLNLVLLKNIEITGVHWGAYFGVYSRYFQGGGRGCLILLQLKNQSAFLPCSKRFSGEYRGRLPMSPNFHTGSSILQSGKVTPVVYPEVCPLERLAKGLVALENRETWGKVAVRVKDEPAPTAKL